MKIKDVLIFKDEHHVDWDATETEVRKLVLHDNPNARASELAMSAASTITELKKMVRRIGVNKLYKNIMGT